MSNNITSVVFDLDGTIYSGSTPAAGALQVVEYLEKKRYNVFYFTNNSARTRLQIAEKLRKMQLSASPKQVYCCLEAVPFFLAQKSLKNIFCCGSRELADVLRQNSFNVYQSEDKAVAFDAVVVGMCPDFTYDMMAQASLALQRNPDCKLIACNLDMNYPVENGYRMPGCGPIAKAVELASGRNIDYIIGKPDTYIVDLIIKEHNLIKEGICIVGDSDESDIAMAEKAGVRSFLVGGTTEKKNAVSIKSLLDLYKYF